MQIYWSEHHGQFKLPPREHARENHLGGMCLTGLAQQHPAAGRLLRYATGGCPAKTRCNWTVAEIEIAVSYGNHISARSKGV